MEKTTYTELQLLQLENSKLVTKIRHLEIENKAFNKQRINVQLKCIEQEKEEIFVNLLRRDCNELSEKNQILRRRVDKLTDLLTECLDAYCYLTYSTDKLIEYGDSPDLFINKLKDTLRK